MLRDHLKVNRFHVSLSIFLNNRVGRQEIFIELGCTHVVKFINETTT
jgi:hypothetical protein